MTLFTIINLRIYTLYEYVEFVYGFLIEIHSIFMKYLMLFDVDFVRHTFSVFFSVYLMRQFDDFN